MSQAEIRAQKQREQNERRLSVQRNNAYFSIRSQSDSESAKPNPSTTLEPPQDSGQRTCPPNLPLTTPMPWSEECASPVPYHISRPTLTSNSVSDNISPNIAATTTSTVTCFTTSIAPTTTTNTPVPADCTAVSTARPILAAQAQINLSASTGNKGKAQERLKNETTKNAAIQTGMDRYVTIKRKLSPQNSTGSKTKINRLTSTQQVSTNRFALLSDNADDVNSQISEGAAKATNAKPPPIFIREENPSALVKKFTQLIGSNKFHIIPLSKGNIRETKVQIYSEQDFRTVSKYLNDINTKFYTYQLKSAKGLQIVIKGIEPSVEAVEVLEALKEQGFNPKAA
ncbi:uncharacterized protein LOC118757062, partial [Rhagoletis pomonella]|uniref:uncharacterized protein LOC118757062 n=1 Tax=Rhagoletis pomonella TaxID=28610 RepID=UPI00177ABDBA